MSALERAKQAVSTEVEGAEHIGTGAAILASNHPASLDFWRLSHALSRRLWLATHQTTSTTRTGLGWLSRGGCLPGVRQVGIDQPAGRRAASASDQLARGELVVCFPEGATSPHPRLLCKGYPDVAWLAMTAQVPVYPVAILPSPTASLARVIRIGEPIDLSRYWSNPALSDGLDAVLLRGATDVIMAAIADLGDLNYVDETAIVYAARLAQARAARREQVRRAHPTESTKRRLAAEERFAREQRQSDDLEAAQNDVRAWVNRALRDPHSPPTPRDIEADQPGMDR